MWRREEAKNLEVAVHLSTVEYRAPKTFSFKKSKCRWRGK